MIVDFGVVAAFALLWAVIVPTPGANSLMVVHIALTHGRAHMLAAIAGNMAGIALIGGAALFGMAVLLETLPWLSRAVTIGGGLYLVYFGVRLILARPAAASPDSHQATTSKPSARQTTAVAVEPLSRSLTVGFFTQLSNAQAIIFVSSIFAVADVLAANIATGLACVGVMIAMNALYLSLLGSLLLLPTPRRLYLRFITPVRRLFGLLFVGFGARLVLRDLMRS